MIAMIWVVSLSALTASAYLIYKLLITSSEFSSSDQPFSFRLRKESASRDKFYRQSLSLLNSKIKSLEDSNAYYEIQFSKFQQQLNSEPNTTPSVFKQPEVLINKNGQEEEEEEDWKELYFEENDRKVKLENELDEALQALEQAHQKLRLQEEKVEGLRELKSTGDSRLIELKSMQNQVVILQKKIDAAAEREKELDSQLKKEIEFKKICAKIENENIRLRSETQDQRRQLVEMASREKEQAQKIVQLTKQLSSRELYENEKNQKLVELKNNMKNNRIFSS